MTTIKTTTELMVKNQLVKHYAGSKSYGTSLPTSDTDFRGIFVADPINIRTPFYNINEIEDSSEEDTKFHELNQFMRLVVDCNPNIIETLWVRDQDIVFRTPAYDLLRQHAPDLLCKKVAFTTSGYAYSQLKRIKGHNKWINNQQPVDAPPQYSFLSLVHNFTGNKTFVFKPEEFHTDYRLIPYGSNTFGVYTAVGYNLFNTDTGSLNTDYEEDYNKLDIKNLKFIVKFNKNEYTTALDTWNNYWTWKKNRNQVRSELEEQFGYDTKHASHSIRLLKMGVEILETGIVHVYRPDAKELLDIRAGKLSYEELIEYAENLKDKIDNHLIHTTQLRTKPNIELASKLILTVQDMIWDNK